ncbi:MAG: rod shape-determining protein [Patescibacteria group bacterium]
MFERLFSLLSQDIGIDLGTANTLVYARDKGIIINEPSVVAINTKTKQVLAIGNEARLMVGRTPSNIVATRPLVDGVISDYEVTEHMLRYFIKKSHEGQFYFINRPRVIIGIPYNITEVERRAVEEATLSAGARSVFLIEEPVAAAIGARLPIQDPAGSMIVDIGGGTTEIAVISLGGIVASRSLRIAGDEMNEAIITHARDKFNLMLGEKTAEEIKVKIGSAAEMRQKNRFTMCGRDLVSGLPKEIIVSDDDIREALKKPVMSIVDAVKATIEETPPELVADIMTKGIILSGGGALLRGLDELLSQATETKVQIAEDPLTCVARGIGIVLEDITSLKDVLLPTEFNK